MKFCKDCKNYVAELTCGGGSLLGFFMHFPAQCKQDETYTNLISGETHTKSIDCSKCRNDEELCGSGAKRFAPATLDGRLAMSEEA